MLHLPGMCDYASSECQLKHRVPPKSTLLLNEVHRCSGVRAELIGSALRGKVGEVAASRWDTVQMEQLKASHNNRLLCARHIGERAGTMHPV
ncbi:hypothetical protein F2P81_021140 [Scophthalmus maximus]|uniref:Uncharacterized protein n=1 Tax=Scophthalmus maximus TaxID=52904 RepID=A0A6A4RWG1_SCOMX|nr:hypothetical protein F2P81_021140 [Scophthalmus maximus]